MEQNRFTRVFVRSTSSIYKRFELIDCIAVDSLSFKQDKEFVNCEKNGRLVPIAVIIDPTAEWSGSISGYFGSDVFNPFNEQKCTFDILILFGSCQRPTDTTTYTNGFILQDCIITSPKVDKIKPLTESESAAITFSADFTCLNGKQLITESELIVDGIFTGGVVDNKCKDCISEVVLFDNTNAFTLNRNGNLVSTPFALNSNPVSISIDNGDLLLATDLEFIITNNELTKDIRIATTFNNFTSLLYESGIVYFTTSDGEFGKIELDTFTISTIHVGTSYNQVISSNKTIVALGNGYYYGNVVNTDVTIDTAIFHNNCIIYSVGRAIMATDDLFQTVSRIGAIAETITTFSNDAGIFYAIGVSGTPYVSYDKGISWKTIELENVVNISGGYTIGDGVYKL